jgi:UDP-glucose 4-epimerase
VSSLAKVLVTGGAGFIGSHLCDDLLARGDHVVCVDNLVSTGGHTNNIENALRHPNFTFIRDDITTWEIDLADVDCIYHQAASKAVVCQDDPELDLAVNAGATLRLLRAAKKAGTRKFVHASTGSVYGESDTMLTEDHPCNPVSFYGVNKFAAEGYCRIVTRQGMDVTVLRYFHVIGARQSTVGVVPYFVQLALTDQPITIDNDGEQTRSFTSVDDVVRANILASDGAAGVFNVASGLSVSINELADFIISEIGSDSKIEYRQRRKGDIDHFRVSADAIGMRFNTDWRGMVREVIAWEASR